MFTIHNFFFLILKPKWNVLDFAHHNEHNTTTTKALRKKRENQKHNPKNYDVVDTNGLMVFQSNVVYENAFMLWK